MWKENVTEVILEGADHVDPAFCLMTTRNQYQQKLFAELSSFSIWICLKIMNGQNLLNLLA